MHFFFFFEVGIRLCINTNSIKHIGTLERCFLVLNLIHTISNLIMKRLFCILRAFCFSYFSNLKFRFSNINLHFLYRKFFTRKLPLFLSKKIINFFLYISVVAIKFWHFHRVNKERLAYYLSIYKNVWSF